jgi:hypothetical protein
LTKIDLNGAGGSENFNQININKWIIQGVFERAVYDFVEMREIKDTEVLRFTSADRKRKNKLKLGAF